jgi:hypothetical protein
MNAPPDATFEIQFKEEMFMKPYAPLGHTLEGDKSRFQISFQYVQSLQRK